MSVTNYYYSVCPTGDFPLIPSILINCNSTIKRVVHSLPFIYSLNYLLLSVWIHGYMLYSTV